MTTTAPLSEAALGDLTIRPIDNREASYGYRALTFPSCRHLLDFDAKAPPIVAMSAQLYGRPSGLLIAVLDPETRQAEIKSIATAPRARRQGVAAALMQEMERALIAVGVERVRATYLEDSAARPALEALCVRHRFAPAQIRCLHLEMSASKTIHASWMRERSLPQGYTALPWRDLPPKILAMLEADDPSFDWVKPHLHPRLNMAGYEPHTSVALLKDGELRAWVITHDLGGVLRASCAYAHPEQQRGARITALFRKGAEAALAHGFDRTSYTIDVSEPRFFAFAERYMRPSAERIAAFLETHKRF